MVSKAKRMAGTWSHALGLRVDEAGLVERRPAVAPRRRPGAAHRAARRGRARGRDRGRRAEAATKDFRFCGDDAAAAESVAARARRRATGRQREGLAGGPARHARRRRGAHRAARRGRARGRDRGRARGGDRASTSAATMPPPLVVAARGSSAFAGRRARAQPADQLATLDADARRIALLDEGEAARTRSRPRARRRQGLPLLRRRCRRL